MFSRNELPDPHMARLHECLANLKADMTVSDFLNQHFAGPEYRRLRHFVVRRVEGYDAADPARGQVIPITPNFERGGASVVAELSHSRKVATEIYLCQTKPTKIAGVNERPNPWPQSDHQNHRSTSSLIAPLPARSLVSPARSPRDRLANTVNGYGTRSSLNLISMKRPVLSC